MRLSMRLKILNIGFVSQYFILVGMMYRLYRMLEEGEAKNTEQV